METHGREVEKIENLQKIGDGRTEKKRRALFPPKGRYGQMTGGGPDSQRPGSQENEVDEGEIRGHG